MLVGTGIRARAPLHDLLTHDPFLSECKKVTVHTLFSDSREGTCATCRYCSTPCLSLLDLIPPYICCKMMQSFYTQLRFFSCVRICTICYCLEGKSVCVLSSLLSCPASSSHTVKSQRTHSGDTLSHSLPYTIGQFS